MVKLGVEIPNSANEKLRRRIVFSATSRTNFSASQNLDLNFETATNLQNPLSLKYAANEFPKIRTTISSPASVYLAVYPSESRVLFDLRLERRSVSPINISISFSDTKPVKKITEPTKKKKKTRNPALKKSRGPATCTYRKNPSRWFERARERRPI